MDKKTEGVLQVLFAIVVVALVLLLNKDIEKFRELGYLGLFIISIASSATVLIPGPGRFVALALGRSLDPIAVGLIGGIGSAIGELTGYIAGHGVSEIVQTSSYFKKFKNLIEKYDAIAIFFLALIPNPLFDLAGIAAGALHMKWHRYLLATACGRIISFAILAYLGRVSLLYF